MQHYTQYHNQSLPQAAQTNDTPSLDWNTFHVSTIFTLPCLPCSHENEQQEMFPLHRLSLPDALPPENMLFSPYSSHSAIPLNAGCQNLLLPHSSTRLTVSTPSSPVSGISESGSSKKTSQAYMVRKANLRKDTFLTFFTEKKISKSRSTASFPSSAKRSHGGLGAETPKHAL
jgi:hypothetical protein